MVWTSTFPQSIGLRTRLHGAQINCSNVWVRNCMDALSGSESDLQMMNCMHDRTGCRCVVTLLHHIFSFIKANACIDVQVYMYCDQTSWRLTHECTQCSRLRLRLTTECWNSDCNDRLNYRMTRRAQPAAKEVTRLACLPFQCCCVQVIIHLEMRYASWL